MNETIRLNILFVYLLRGYTHSFVCWFTFDQETHAPFSPISILSFVSIVSQAYTQLVNHKKTNRLMATQKNVRIKLMNFCIVIIVSTWLSMFPFDDIL